MTAILTLLLTTASWGMTVPNGWIAVGDTAAVLDPQEPGLGELRELSLPTSSPGVEALIERLASQGEQARLKSQEPGGDINLVIAPDKLARARASTTPAGTTWYLVVAVESAANQLDTNALLTIMQGQIPLQLSWGTDIEVLPAGNDGSLWDIPSQQERSTEGWTGSVDTPSLKKDSRLFGVWKGNATYLGKRQEIRLTLDAIGRARLERECEGRTCVWEGTWGVSSGRLIIQPYTGTTIDSPYDLHGLTKLEFTLEGQTISLSLIK